MAAIPTSQQTARIRRFAAGASVDVHCHCLPGLDDGPATLAEAVELCRALAADGITLAIATPHQLGRYDLANSPATVEAAVVQLRDALAEAGVPLSVERGADVRVDERLVRLLADGRVSGLGPTGRYVLLELPHDTFIDLGGLVRTLAGAGRRAIVSHPERHPYLVRHPDAVLPWIEHGAVLQVTAGSLAGAFGADAEAAGWHWLERGLVQLVATDAHGAHRRPPLMSAAIDRITARVGQPVARIACIENPIRVLRGEDVEPVRRTLPAAVAARAAPAGRVEQRGRSRRGLFGALSLFR